MDAGSQLEIQWVCAFLCSFCCIPRGNHIVIQPLVNPEVLSTAGAAAELSLCSSSRSSLPVQ